MHSLAQPFSFRNVVGKPFFVRVRCKKRLLKGANLTFDDLFVRLVRLSAKRLGAPLAVACVDEIHVGRDDEDHKKKLPVSGRNNSCYEDGVRWVGRVVENIDRIAAWELSFSPLLQFLGKLSVEDNKGARYINF